MLVISAVVYSVQRYTEEILVRPRSGHTTAGQVDSKAPVVASGAPSTMIEVQEVQRGPIPTSDSSAF